MGNLSFRQLRETPDWPIRMSAGVPCAPPTWRPLPAPGASVEEIDRWPYEHPEPGLWSRYFAGLQSLVGRAYLGVEVGAWERVTTGGCGNCNHSGTDHSAEGCAGPVWPEGREPCSCSRSHYQTSWADYDLRAPVWFGCTHYGYADASGCGCDYNQSHRTVQGQGTLVAHLTNGGDVWWQLRDVTLWVRSSGIPTRYLPAGEENTPPNDITGEGYFVTEYADEATLFRCPDYGPWGAADWRDDWGRIVSRIVARLAFTSVLLPEMSVV